MKRMQLLTLWGLAGLLSVGAVYAQDAGDEAVDQDELTMIAIPDPEADLPQAVTEAIELPGEASEEGVTNSAEGLATANAARERAPDGLDTAADAREHRADFGLDRVPARPETVRSGP